MCLEWFVSDVLGPGAALSAYQPGPEPRPDERLTVLFWGAGRLCEESPTGSSHLYKHKKVTLVTLHK